MRRNPYEQIQQGVSDKTPYVGTWTPTTSYPERELTETLSRLRQRLTCQKRRRYVCYDRLGRRSPCYVVVEGVFLECL